MCRDRAWRRYKQEVKTKNRLILSIGRDGWWNFRDVNGIKIENPQWFDFIGTEMEFKFKTLTTTRYDSKYKTKWGKRGFLRSNELKTRIGDKKFFKIILRDELYESN